MAAPGRPFSFLEKRMDDLTKPVSVGLLFIFLAAMDLLKINDPELRYACFGLVTSITGWHALINRAALKAGTPTVLPPPQVGQ
jgi:hypothetical protein